MDYSHCDVIRSTDPRAKGEWPERERSLSRRPTAAPLPQPRISFGSQKSLTRKLNVSCRCGTIFSLSLLLILLIERPLPDRCKDSTGGELEPMPSKKKGKDDCKEWCHYPHIEISKRQALRSAWDSTDDEGKQAMAKSWVFGSRGPRPFLPTRGRCRPCSFTKRYC